MRESSFRFHAGSTFEPLLGGKTRIKTYANGGALISDELVSSDEAVKRFKACQALLDRPDLDKDLLL